MAGGLGAGADSNASGWCVRPQRRHGARVGWREVRRRAEGGGEVELLVEEMVEELVVVLVMAGGRTDMRKRL